MLHGCFVCWMIAMDMNWSARISFCYEASDMDFSPFCGDLFRLDLQYLHHFVLLRI